MWESATFVIIFKIFQLCHKTAILLEVIRNYQFYTIFILKMFQYNGYPLNGVLIEFENNGVGNSIVCASH